MDQAGARLIAAAADGERRRLERDLHDGAQQRLVSLSVRLRLLASRVAPGSEAEQLLADARSELAASPILLPAALAGDSAIDDMASA